MNDKVIIVCCTDSSDALNKDNFFNENSKNLMICFQDSITSLLIEYYLFNTAIKRFKHC